MRQSETLFWIWLAEALGAASSDFRHIIESYETPYDVYEASSEELERYGTLKEKTVLSLSDKNLQRASEILDACQRLGIGILTYRSELYPQSLREIKNPPVVLYYVGTVPKFEERLCIGLVGTRRMSEYGMETAYKISYELSSGNAVTVSGLAAGIDGVCAAATLKAGGTTVAVLGCGLDRAYPTHHGKLMNEVAKHGLLLSEYPPGTKPLFYNFPVRNRIISGLSHAVVVVEAGLGSGSLITAKEAVMQGKDVFAVPANADGVGAEGANGLLRDGAFFAACADDISRRYEYLFPSAFRADLASEAKKRSRPDIGYLQSMGVLNRATSKDSTQTDEPSRSTPRKSTTATKKIAPVDATEADGKLQTRSDLKTVTKEPTAASKPQMTSDAVLQSLNPVQLEVMQAIPDDQTVSSDVLIKLGYPYGEILTALTMLEIMGLVEKLPGGVYRKT